MMQQRIIQLEVLQVEPITVSVQVASDLTGLPTRTIREWKLRGFVDYQDKLPGSREYVIFYDSLKAYQESQRRRHHTVLELVKRPRLGRK